MKRRLSALFLAALPLLGLVGCAASPSGASSSSVPAATPTASPEPTVAAEPNTEPVLTDEAASLGVTAEMLERGMTSDGNLARLADVMRRAEQGEPIHIVVFGGSITQGAAATSEDDRYANRVAAWWRETFPQSTITLTNAGIGATNTVLGIHRVQSDVLDYGPDLVIMEFSVNDAPGDLAQLATYEACVRAILAREDCALVLFYMATLQSDGCQQWHMGVGNYYDLPQVSYGDAFKGESFWEEQCADGVHPKSEGHRRAGCLLNWMFERVYLRLDSIADQPEPLPETPMIADASAYTSPSLYDLADESDAFTVTPGGFVKNDAPAFTQKLSFRGYTSSEPGEPMQIDLASAREAHLLLLHGPDQGKVLVTSSTGKREEIDLFASWGSYMWATVRLQDADPAAAVTLTVTPLEGSVTVLALLTA